VSSNGAAVLRGESQVTQNSSSGDGLQRSALRRAVLPAVFVVALLAAGAAMLGLNGRGEKSAGDPPHSKADRKQVLEVSSQVKKPRVYTPTPEQWAMLTVEPVSTRAFRTELFTEGKIAINEELSTPVFSPYVGRVTRLAARPGEFVKAGQPLFFIEANDMVQAQNDFMAALATVSKAQARVTLTEIVEKQNRRLLETKAGSLRDAQVAEAEVTQARSEMRVSETALEAARNRLRLLGKTDEEITNFENKGRISPETPIHTPIDGTVVQRRVGPGQYVSYTSTGSLDPAYVIGNLSTVWVVAFVRESDAPRVRVGQQMEFRVAAYPDRVFPATIDYVSASLDTATRRLLVRATVSSEDFAFKPEMFVSATIYGNGDKQTVGLPRDAVIVEAGSSRVWVVRPDRSIEMRSIKTGLVNGTMIEVVEGLSPGDQVVTRGSIFVDRAAEG